MPTEQVDAAPETGETPQTEPAQTATDESLPEGVRLVMHKEREARRHAEAELKQVQARLSEIEDAEKSEAQKQAEKAEAQSARAEKAERELARLRVATKKGLPPELADRLVGDSDEDLEADADRLLAMFTPSTPAPVPMDAGVRSNGADPAPSDPNDLLRRLVGG